MTVPLRVNGQPRTGDRLYWIIMTMPERIGMSQQRVTIPILLRGT